MIELSFRISGNYYLGGRGLAFWYTKDRGQDGPVFGNKDQWNGLGIMFETTDPKKKVSWKSEYSGSDTMMTID